MAKTSKSAPSKDKKQKDILTTVKDGGITKAAESVKSKATEIAKKVAPSLMGKETKKDSKPSKKKAPTPESESDSDDADSSDASDSEASSSESEDEKPVSKAKAAPAAKTNRKVTKKDDSSDDSSEEDSDDDNSKDEKPAAKDDSDDSSSDSDEEEEKPKAAAAKVNGTGKAQVNGKASKDSSSEEEDSDSDDSSDDEEEAKPASKAKAEPAVAKKAEDSDDSEDDSDDSSDSDSSEDDEEKPKAADSKKRKADTEAESPVKKSKSVQLAENATKTLFVGQLSWAVDDAWLAREFEGYNIESARVMWDNQKDRSKGFAYVDFATVEDAQTALNEKQGMEIDGRGVNLDFSQPRQNQNNATDRAKKFGDSQSPPSDTLFIGNMSFQCDENMLGEAFAEYGEIVSVRIPTDRDTGNKKGFAYVTFSSIDEAKAANSAMNGQVVAGRPIRTDFSQPRDNSSGGGGGRGGRGGGFGGGFGGGRGRGGDRGRGGRGGGRGGDRGGRGGRGGFNSNRTPVAMGKKMTFDD